MRLTVAAMGGAVLDSDEAVFGLMARHALDGDVPAFMYGQRYLGSLEALVASAWTAVVGPGIMPVRLGAITLFGGFLAVHATLVRRWFGDVATLVSLVVLALPGFHMLWLTFRPVGAFSAMLLFGTSALLLADARPFRGRLLCLGGVIGLGAWSHPMTLVYPVALGAVRLLGGPEWRVLGDRLRRGSRRVLGIGWLGPLVLVGALAGGVTAALFADGCPPGSLWSTAHTAARIGLPVLGAVVGAAVVGVSRRRPALVRTALPVGAGTLLGWAPAWVPWLLFGPAPASGALAPSCPTDVPDRAGTVAGELLPATLGASARPEATDPTAWWTLLLVVPVAAVLWSVVRHRRPLAAMVTLRPLGEDGARVALWAVLIVGPVALAALSTNTLDVWSARYLIVSWHATAVVLGLFAAQAGRRWRPWSTALVVLWAAVVGVAGMVEGRAKASADRGSVSAPALGGVQAALRSHGVEHGSADYWVAYRLDLLLEERIRLSPFRNDRYGAYARAAAQADRFAVVVERGVVPDRIDDAEGLAAALDLHPPGLAPGVERVGDARVIAREQPPSWDVWILEAPR